MRFLYNTVSQQSHIYIYMLAKKNHAKRGKEEDRSFFAHKTEYTVVTVTDS